MSGRHRRKAGVTVYSIPEGSACARSASPAARHEGSGSGSESGDLTFESQGGMMR
jgi:hypothetical protein